MTKENDKIADMIAEELEGTEYENVTYITRPKTIRYKMPADMAPISHMKVPSRTPNKDLFVRFTAGLLSLLALVAAIWLIWSNQNG